MIPYTEHEIYLLLENSNCIQDIQHVANYLNDSKDCFTPGAHEGFIRLLKVYVNLFV